MSDEALDHAVATQWLSIVTGYSTEARALLARAAGHASEHADVFYDAMLRDPEARDILRHHQVSERLRPSMTRWIEACLTHYEPDQIAQMIALQRYLGNLHARVGVKIDVLLRSARNVKDSIVRAIAPDRALDAAAFEALHGALSIIDLALEAMSAQYSTAQQVAARTGEAYRNFALSMNLTLERERQRAALLDWENQTLQSLMMGDEHRALQSIGESSFGMWVRHKAAAMLPVGDALVEISGAMNRIDGVLLPECARVAAVAGSSRLRETLQTLLSEVKRVGYIADTLFEQLIALEQGRDALTQLLSQRFQSTILSREIELSRASERPLAAMLVAVDRFRDLCEMHGDAAGDRVLQHVAGCIVASVSAGDFVFRHGVDQFLVLCVEQTDEAARRVAGLVLGGVAAEDVPVGPQRRARVTASIGLALHDGHPDYQRLIDRAGAALMRAQATGFNHYAVSGG